MKPELIALNPELTLHSQSGKYKKSTIFFLFCFLQNKTNYAVGWLQLKQGVLTGKTRDRCSMPDNALYSQISGSFVTLHEDEITHTQC